MHKATVEACYEWPEPEARAGKKSHFRHEHGELLALRDWLAAHGMTHVAMEATGVYWKPVYYVLEDDFALLLVNAAHVKQVPGRKTDVADCAWLAQLLEHGLLCPSFVPPRPIRELRDLTRPRKSLIQERTRMANRLHNVLQDSGIKLSSAATEVLGMSGRPMLSALMGETTDPNQLAERQEIDVEHPPAGAP